MNNVDLTPARQLNANIVEACEEVSFSFEYEGQTITGDVVKSNLSKMAIYMRFETRRDSYTIPSLFGENWNVTVLWSRFFTNEARFEGTVRDDEMLRYDRYRTLIYESWRAANWDFEQAGTRASEYARKVLDCIKKPLLAKEYPIDQSGG